MTSFDSWEDRIRPSGDCLMHFGIKGMKHGRRRYQNEDGTWTDTGLAARRKREGFGERRAERKVKKLERKREKSEQRKAKAEARRLKSIKGLTDAELQQRINRLKKEQEYHDLNRNPTIQMGKELIDKFLTYKNEREERAAELNRQKIEMARLEVQRLQAKNSVSKAKAEASKAKYESKSAKSKVKEARQKRRSGQKYLNKKDYLGAKKAYKQAKKQHWKTGGGRGGSTT